MADSDTTGRQAFWDGMWSSDAEDPFWNQVDPEVAALAGSTSPQDRPDVLDLGCGPGRNAIAFARAGCRVTAVDFSEEGLGHLRARAADLGLVDLYGSALDDAIARLSTHSLRVGLTQDLFASGEDAGPIAQTLRWSSTATALRYGRELAPESNATARMLRKVRR